MVNECTKMRVKKLTSIVRKTATLRRIFFYGFVSTIAARIITVNLHCKHVKSFTEQVVLLLPRKAVKFFYV